MLGLLSMVYSGASKFLWLTLGLCYFIGACAHAVYMLFCMADSGTVCVPLADLGIAYSFGAS